MEQSSSLRRLSKEHTAKQGAEKLGFGVGRGFIPGLEFLHFQSQGVGLRP
jgi:hypothetical protein